MSSRTHTPAIAKRNGEPAWVNPPAYRRGDMASWYPGKTVRPSLFDRIFRRASAVPTPAPRGNGAGAGRLA